MASATAPAATAAAVAATEALGGAPAINLPATMAHPVTKVTRKDTVAMVSFSFTVSSFFNIFKSFFFSFSG